MKQPGCADVKQNALGVDLSRLSANTLKLLGRAATVLSRSNLPVSASSSDELQLTAIVDWLNQAAAKNKRSTVPLVARAATTREKVSVLVSPLVVQ